MLEFFSVLDAVDAVFGTCGSWQEAEGRVSGTAENPPFEKDILHEVVTTFESGALLDRPYCR